MPKWSDKLVLPSHDLMNRNLFLVFVVTHKVERMGNGRRPRMMRLFSGCGGGSKGEVRMGCGLGLSCILILVVTFFLLWD